MTATIDRPSSLEWISPYILPSELSAGSPDDDAPSRKSRYLTRLRTEGALVFLLCAAAYLVGAYFLDFVYLTFNGDAVSRMANGFYVLYSRDPHLAAIGFVWNPGQSIADMVPLLFNHLWPALSSHDVAGSLVSSLAMAGSAYELLAMLRESGVQRAPRLVVVALYALNPMIVYYGANGMSEGLYLFTLVATARYMNQWIRTNHVRPLVHAAMFLGLCYVVRNEALGAAMLGALVVIGVSWSRSSGPFRGRLSVALTDVTIFELPFVVSVVAWLTASYVITGSPLEQFTSVYGNATQEKFLTHKNLHGRLVYIVQGVESLAPMLLVALVIALIVARKRRDLGVFVPLAIVGGGLGFDALSYVVNSIQPFLRYFITAVPLDALLIGFLFSTQSTTPWLRKPLPTEASTGLAVDVSRRRRPLFAAFGVVGAIVLLTPALVTTVLAIEKPSIGYEESEFLGLVLNRHLSPTDQQVKEEYPGEVRMSSYFERLDLPNGSVIVDNGSGCIPGTITMSENPKIFVIPNDRNFQRTLVDPPTFHASYILEADPIGVNSVTSINSEYPTLWRTGAGFTRRVATFYAGDCHDFRLFKVVSHPSPDVQGALR